MSHRNVERERERESVRERGSVGGNHSCHNAKLINQPAEKQREQVKPAKEGKESSPESSEE